MIFLTPEQSALFSSIEKKFGTESLEYMYLRKYLVDHNEKIDMLNRDIKNLTNGKVKKKRVFVVSQQEGACYNNIEVEADGISMHDGVLHLCDQFTDKDGKKQDENIALFPNFINVTLKR